MPLLTRNGFQASVEMNQAPREDKPVIVDADEARGALAPEETSKGDTLLPMLIGGLVLIVGCMAVVVLVF